MLVQTTSPIGTALQQRHVQLDEAERHVREGQLRLGRQLAFVAELRDVGSRVNEAEALLTTFIDVLASFIARRDRLLKEARLLDFPRAGHRNADCAEARIAGPTTPTRTDRLRAKPRSSIRE